MSAISSVDRHPDNVSLAAGGADTKARDFYACINDVDKKPVLFPLSWCYDKLTVALLRPAPTSSNEKLPFMANPLALLDVGCIQSLSFHLEMFLHS